MSFPTPEPQSALKSYCELLRLPNVFTAIADVLMGYLFASSVVEVGPTLYLLIGASACLYLSGMVLNDVFDFATDLAERPTRPLPSGRISLATATLLGYSLWIVGLLLGCGVSSTTGDPRTAIFALALAATVWLYDRILKRTPLGPLAMGGCRTLNVLMGMSTGPVMREWGLTTADWCVAGGIGVYIAGVTSFARREAARSRPAELALAILVIVMGLAAMAAFPWLATPTENNIMGRFNDALDLGARWWVLWALIGGSVIYRCVLAVQRPVAARVQVAVKHALVSLIVIDAAVTFAVQGRYPWPLVILALLIPTVLIGRWIYST